MSHWNIYIMQKFFEKISFIFFNHRKWVSSAFIGLLFMLPFILSLTSNHLYLMDILVTCCIYIILSMGLNIVVGMAGLLDLGYIAFYAVGAYTAAILTTQFGISIWLIFPIGMFSAAILGILLGLPTLRLRGDYLAIVTLGFGEIIRISLNNLDAITNGPKGIMGISKPFFWNLELRHIHYLYFVVLGLTLFTWVIVKRLENSSIGRSWIAIREDELAAEVMGINTVKMKLLAFAIGASFAGGAGVFFASRMGFVSPESFIFIESVIIVSMVVLGGLGSIPGVIIGAIILTILPELFRELPSLISFIPMAEHIDFSQYRMLLFGGAMVVIMLMRPEGLVGQFSWNNPHRSKKD